MSEHSKDMTQEEYEQVIKNIKEGNYRSVTDEQGNIHISTDVVASEPLEYIAINFKANFDTKENKNDK